MLVLSRKVGELIHVGDDVTIEVRRVAGNRVTMAIDAPRHKRILRGELKERVDDGMDGAATHGVNHVPSLMPSLNLENKENVA